MQVELGRNAVHRRVSHNSGRANECLLFWSVRHTDQKKRTKEDLVLFLPSGAMRYVRLAASSFLRGPT